MMTSTVPESETITNRQWIYRKRPTGEVSADHYELVSQALPTKLEPGELLVRARYFSVDPYMRIQQSAGETWEAPFPLNTVQGGDTVAEVIAANDPSGTIAPGDLVNAYIGWQTHARCRVDQVRRLNDPRVSPTTALGVLGMPGRTAYFGLQTAGRPRQGETAVVSGAAGAVGSIVVQLAKHAGCRVIGIAGSPEKAAYLCDELGADGAIVYKDHPTAVDMADALAAACPNGIDIYYDNVGGIITDAAVTRMNQGGRVIICGQISQYNGGLDQPVLGPRLLHHVLYKRLTIQGILARDFAPRMQEMLEVMSPLVASGRIKFRETRMQGFENLPAALNALFHGKNIGKMIVKA